MSNLNELINNGMVKLVEKKQTNGDFIRSMNDEELARELHKISRMNGRDINKSINNCNCWTADFLAWLQSEVSE